MSKKPNIVLSPSDYDAGHSSDYAYMKCGRRSFYYGYEEVNTYDEWMFVERMGETIRRKIHPANFMGKSEIERAKPSDILAMGIAYLLSLEATA